MKKNDGFAVKEMIILSGILAIVFAILITKVSFAYKDALREEDTKNGIKNSLLIAAKAYAEGKKEEFKKEETFIYGSDLIDAGYLVDAEELGYKNIKIKINYVESSKKFNAEIVNE